MQKQKVRHILGENIKILRRIKGLSQEEFADVCNLHRTYIGSMERGERNVSIDTVEKIAKAFDLTFSKLLDKIIEIEL